MYSTQEEVFQNTVLPIVEEVLQVKSEISLPFFLLLRAANLMKSFLSRSPSTRRAITARSSLMDKR